MKLLKFFATIVMVAIVLIVGVLGYAGLIPGVSAVFGANKPRDLGVPHTAQDLVSGQAKLQQTFVRPTEALTIKTILNAGSSAVNTTLTAAEWAAHLEAIHPVKDLQVKFLSDGTFEASGRVDKARIFDAVKLLGYTNVSQAKTLETVKKYLPGDAVFYMKGRGEMVDDKATVALDRYELGRLPVGQGAFSKMLASYANLMADNVPGLSIKVLEVKDGNLHIEGKAPKQLPQF